MFAGSQQNGFISIFYSVGSNPLALWDKQVKNGHIRRVIDDEVKSLVLDVGGTNVATTYITCPIKPRASLGVRLPYLVMVIKNMKKYFSFEIQILDDKDMRRRFRVSNFQSTTKVRPFCTTMPIGLSAGWNQVQFNLADFTKRAYGSMYLETIRVQIHANVRIRRIYFTDQLHSDEDLPNEFKLFAPGPKGKLKEKKPSKEALAQPAEGPVPPIDTKGKPEEEVPPPPTPAEESPVAKEEPTPEGTPIEPETPVTAESGEPTEGEAPLAEGEGAPEQAPEAAEEAKPEEPPEGGEAEVAPAEDEPTPVVEGGEPGSEPAEAATEGDSALVAEGDEVQPPAEGLEEGAPEGDAAAETEQSAAHETAEGEGVPGEEAAEPTVEDTTEQSENVVESTTEAATTDVSESAEESPSEPATTDQEEA